MDLFSVEHLPSMGLELTLGICIKLFCDNGRIHWRDFVTDCLFWVPGLTLRPAMELPHTEDSALAAK